MPVLSINLLVDQATEQAVRVLQQSLAPDGVSFAQRYPPHITLTAYQFDDGAETEYLSQLPLLTRQRRQFPLLLESLGIFPETGVLFLAPRMSQTLLSIHQAAIDQFSSPVLDALLSPGRWTPHVTIAASPASDRLLSILDKALSLWQPIRGKAVGIGIRIHPATSDSGQSLFGV
ncbi:MAG TPA: 2'-5' RNA ligase family protein [Ktedonobacterales bacterium]|nr:2'-5' RNA ligase family protein [Ktedonobacterales bacterium]